MALIPKRVKYRKTQKGNMKGTAIKGSRIVFGEYGLQAMESAWINTRQIEAVRLVLTRFLKQGSKIWIRIFADKPVTKHPAEARMGKGKGDPDHWVSVVRQGRILFELEGATLENAKEAFRLAADKLPIRTKFITRHSL